MSPEPRNFNDWATKDIHWATFTMLKIRRQSCSVYAVASQFVPDDRCAILWVTGTDIV